MGSLDGFLLPIEHEFGFDFNFTSESATILSDFWAEGISISADPVLGLRRLHRARSDFMGCRHYPFILVAVVATIAIVSPVLAQCPCVTQASGFAGGDGSPGDPYQVCLPAHLDNVRNHLSSHFIQTADLDMSGFGNFTPIGSEPSKFTGVYDGSSNEISGLAISFPSTDSVGLFGSADNTSILRNISLTAGAVSGSQNVGCLVGQLRGLLEGSSANCTVSGLGFVGTLVGTNNTGTILISKSEGQVNGENGVGGLAGQLLDSTLRNSFSTSTVTATVFVGASLAGYTNNSLVEYCYGAGSVSDTSGFGGGLIAFADGGPSTVTASFWDVNTTGFAVSAGGVGRTTTEMQMQSTFDPPWDFTSTWSIDEGNDYPRLQTPSLTCVFDCQCDDTLVCNGSETCNAGACLPGIDAATGLPCDLDGSPGVCNGSGSCVLAVGIPTVSEWGIAAMLLLTMTAGTLVIIRQRQWQTNPTSCERWRTRRRCSKLTSDLAAPLGRESYRPKYESRSP